MNFFINTTSQEKANEKIKSLGIPKNISNWVECLPVSTKVHSTLRTKHLVLEGVRTVQGIHQDLDVQTIKFEILLAIMKTAKYGTDGLGRIKKKGSIFLEALKMSASHCHGKTHSDN